MTTYTHKLTPEQAVTLQQVLKRKGFDFKELPHSNYAASDANVNVVSYKSGKLVVQGKGTREFVEFVLEPEVLLEAKLGYEEILNPELLLPRIGVDESGKGDFFGPMCVAGVYINEKVIRSWEGQGIQDSKNIGSSRRILDLARLIKETPGCVHAVVTIGNEAYNRLYTKMNSVNRLLAWGHARVIENLMLKQDQMNPPPVRAISDQFAQSKDTVAKALMGLGRTSELVQRHKAEADLAVAAASILAREDFVRRLADLEKRFGLELPKGANTGVEAAGKLFIERQGVANLEKVAKMHFRTSFRVRGLPEPPVKEWNRKKA